MQSGDETGLLPHPEGKHLIFYIRSLSLGCKLNQIESESIAAKFISCGFKVIKPGESPCEGKVVLSIVNTCTVTGKAEQKARHSIRDLLREDPDSLILVTGCYAQLEAEALMTLDKRILVVQGEKKGKLSEMPESLIPYLTTGSDPFHTLQQKILEFPFLYKHPDKSQLPSAGFTGEKQANDSINFKPGMESVKNKKKNTEKILLKSFKNDSSTFNLSTDELIFHSRASIKIQDGCNYRCSYCRICYARGDSVSLDAGKVVERIQNLEAKGWGEVVLTGVNLSLYKSGTVDFTGLLKRIIENTSKILIRISSLYPNYVNQDFLNVISSERIAPHFHLSIQSGSEKILQLMRRPHSAEEIFNAVENIRKVKDNPFLACDIITGFPGETDEDFDCTLNMCKKINFSWIHGFPFSPRPGTEAWYMKPKIPQRIAGERLKKLMDIAVQGRHQYIDSCTGKSFYGIVETNRKSGNSILTDNYLHCLDYSGKLLTPGTKVKVKIKENLLKKTLDKSYSLGNFDCKCDIEFFT